MAQTMTASGNPMTDGQIDNIVDKLRAAVRKHRTEITSTAAQHVLGVENLGMELYAIIRKYAKTAVPVWRTITSGLTRDQLVAGATAKGRDIGMRAGQLIAKTVITSGTTYRLVVILGEEFTDEERTYSNIRAVAKTRGCPNPPAEVALLLAQFTQEELGHRVLVVMHDPISDFLGIPSVLWVVRSDVGGDWVGAWSAGPMSQFDCECAFVFLALQEVVA